MSHVSSDAVQQSATQVEPLDYAGRAPARPAALTILAAGGALIALVSAALSIAGAMRGGRSLPLIGAAVEPYRPHLVWVVDHAPWLYPSMPSDQMLTSQLGALGQAHMQAQLDLITTRSIYLPQHPKYQQAQAHEAETSRRFNARIQQLMASNLKVFEFERRGARVSLVNLLLAVWLFIWSIAMLLNIRIASRLRHLYPCVKILAALAVAAWFAQIIRQASPGPTADLLQDYRAIGIQTAVMCVVPIVMLGTFCTRRNRAYFKRGRT